MKKLKLWVMAATLVCGSSVFTSCSSNDDNPSQPVNNLAEKLIGKWINVADDGKATPTNQKRVLTFLSPTKALFSISGTNPVAVGWYTHQDCDVTINGSHVTVSTAASGMNIVCEYDVRSVSDTEMDTEFSFKNSVNVQVFLQTQGTQRFQRINADYSQDIIGLWEGRVTSTDDDHTDGELHHWEYRTDGTYVYYSLVDGQWTASNDNVSGYFVDGILLCTRWKKTADSEELREWWEIESIKDGVMKWTALREREDGSTYTASFEMKKVE